MHILNYAYIIATLDGTTPSNVMHGVTTIDAHRSADTALVDVHTHAIDEDLPDLSSSIRTTAGPASSAPAKPKRRLMFGGVPYRRIDHRCWSADARLADMDREGVAVQVLSPIPVTFCYQASAAGAAELASAQNEFFARIVRAAPDPLRRAGRRRPAGPRPGRRRAAPVHAPARDSSVSRSARRSAAPSWPTRAWTGSSPSRTNSAPWSWSIPVTRTCRRG